MARGLGKNRRGFANTSVTKVTSTSVTELGGSISFYAPFDSDVNDDSSNGHTVTAQNSAAITTSVKKFGAGSLSLNGSNQYLSVAGSTDFSFGTGDFTIEFWVYPLSNSGTGSGFDNILSAGASDNFWQVGYSNGSSNIRLRRQGGQDDNLDLQTGGDTVLINQWYHIAICRDGTEIKIFINGSKKTLIGNPNTYDFIGQIHPDNLFNSESSGIEIGRNYGSTNSAHYFKGYIDDLRIIKGTALYTSSFVAPTSAVGTTAEITNTIVENKFLSSVWSLKDQNKKISKGEWIRNDYADTAVDGKGRSIKGAGLQVSGHRHFTGPGIAASGGNEITTPTHIYHVFTSPGTFNMTGAQGQVEYLVIGGGGAGGHGGQWMSLGGGGGAGGLRTGYLDPLTPGAYPVTVGQYGTSRSYNTGNPGQPSSFATITAAGGGGGGLGRQPNSQSKTGDAGGSGGGHGSTTGSGGNFPARAAGNTPPTTPSQGNPGGFGASDIPGSYPDPNVAGFAVAGGGGGAGSAGFDGGQVGLGHGGQGTTLPQFPGPLLSGVLPGDSVTAVGPTGIWASGGGAGSTKPGGRGQYMGGVGGTQSTHPAPNDHGQGGGGYGANPSVNGREGANGTGGGGGGGMHNPGPPGGQVYNRPGERGGNGIVIIRYEV